MVLKNFFYLLSANTATIIYGAVSGILMAKTFGPEGIGFLAKARVYFGIVSDFMFFNIYETVTLLMNEQEHQQQKFATLMIATLFEIICKILVTGIGIGIYCFISDDWNYQHLAIVCGLTILMDCCSQSWRGMRRTIDDFGRISIVQTMKEFISMVGIVGLYFTDYFTLLNCAYVFLISASIIFIIQARGLILYFIKSAKEDRTIRKENLTHFFKFIGGNYIPNLLAAYRKNLDHYIATTLCPVSFVGLYAIARNLRDIMFSIVTVFQQLITQEISKKSENKNFQSQSLMKISKYWKLSWSIFVICSLPTVYFFVPIIYGEAYQEASYIYFILIIGTWALGLLPGVVVKMKMKRDFISFIKHSALIGSIIACSTPFAFTGQLYLIPAFSSLGRVAGALYCFNWLRKNKDLSPSKGS